MSDESGRGGESFLGRWSRRKQADDEIRQREDRRVEEELARERATAEPTAAVAAQPPPAAPADLPPLDSLTPDSDYGRFMRPDVPTASRNAAMKKLFTEPHFNVMDGLDIYIDDYTKPDPIPLAMLKELAQSRMLRLFEDAVEEGGAASPTKSAADERADCAAPPAAEIPAPPDASPASELAPDPQVTEYREPPPA